MTDKDLMEVLYDNYTLNIKMKTLRLIVKEIEKENTETSFNESQLFVSLRKLVKEKY